MRWPLQVKGTLAALCCVAAVWVLRAYVPSATLLVALLGVVPFVTLGLVHVWVVRPLRRILAALGRDGGQFLRRAPERGKDELAALGRAVNQALAHITDLEVQAIDQLREQTLVVELGRTLTAALEIEECLATVCRLVAEKLEIDEVVVLLEDPGTQDVEVAAAHGVPEEVGILGLRFAVGEGITGRVFEGEGLLYVPDVSRDDRFLHWKGRHRLEEGSFAGIAMAFRGRHVGVLGCTRRRPNGFTESELRVLRVVAQQAAIAVRNARLYQQTMELATHDGLTGLLNRRLFLEHLDVEWARSCRFDLTLSILVIDIDHFKAYNDSHGHLVGDQVLVHVASTLQRMVRKSDAVARYGGEEFVVMLPGTEAAAALEVGEKLRRAVQDTPFAITNVTVPTPTISVGVATRHPMTAQGPAVDLLDEADQALFKAKAEGRNRVVAATFQTA